MPKKAEKKIEAAPKKEPEVKLGKTYAATGEFRVDEFEGGFVVIAPNGVRISGIVSREEAEKTALRFNQ